MYSTEQLVTILDNGLSDRDVKVVKHCEKIIAKLASKKSILGFMSSLIPQQNQTLVEKITFYLISDKKFDFAEIEKKQEYLVEYNILHRIYLQKTFKEGVSKLNLIENKTKKLIFCSFICTEK